MLDLSSGLETGIVATGLGVMLGLAIWILFRRETRKGQSLFLKMIDPFDDEVEPCTTVPPGLPSAAGVLSKDLFPTPHHGAEVLNQSMRLIPIGLPQKTLNVTPSASLLELHDEGKAEKR